MLTEKEILDTLDNYKSGYDPAFVELGHPYVFPIDSRINVFRNNNNKWALAVETLGYNPRSEPIALDITYYGNCLINLESRENYISNSYCIFPIDEESFNNTIEFERLKPNAKYWVVRGEKLELSHSKIDYQNAKVPLKEYEPNEISAEEVARFLVTKNKDLFRATKDELYKSIPKELDKILVIDEWHHRDFYQNDLSFSENLPDNFPTSQQLKEAFENSTLNLEAMNISKDALLNALNFEVQDKKRIKHNNKERESNRPSAYETWQMIAKVLVTGNTKFYTPTLKPTSHWSNWPEAGTM